MADTPWGFALTATDEDGYHVTLGFVSDKQPARTPQADNLRTQLSKLGNSPFEVATDKKTGAPDIALRLSDNWFIPSSVLTDWRRQVVERLTAVRRAGYRRELAVWKPTTHRFPATSLTYLGNVMNAAAQSFYQEHGLQSIDPAFEKQSVPEAVLMFASTVCATAWAGVPRISTVVRPIASPTIWWEPTDAVSGWSLTANGAR